MSRQDTDTDDVPILPIAFQLCISPLNRVAEPETFTNFVGSPRPRELYAVELAFAVLVKLDNFYQLSLGYGDSPLILFFIFPRC